MTTKTNPSWNYNRAELWADGVIHVLGVILGLIGAVALLIYTLPVLPVSKSMAIAIYALSLVLVLTMSALYNIWPVSRVKWFLRRFDHAAIYVLIAGTYTPFLIQTGGQAPYLLSFVWGVALLGVSLKLMWPARFERLSIVLYLALGWSGILVYDTLFQVLSPTTLWLIAAGGVVYSLGVIFHVWERLRFQNAIWHGFVVSGAALHYCAVFFASSLT
ncbi:PAQR family membrane homeostasis protein TrhA [Paenochrobactrum pullorum]|uniref:PAQR family membrane homeostasis protein TrhA n=1 Tax=Paenochrobactrum pullorum TaxID=1324351 RepID=UPI0035BC29F2